MLKIIRDIYDAARLMHKVRRDGFQGNFVLMTDLAVKAQESDTRELYNRGLLIWDTLIGMVKGESPCGNCLFNEDKCPCPERCKTGCIIWCPRTMAEEDNRYDARREQLAEQSAAPKSGEANAEVHAGADSGAKKSPAV